MASVVDMEKSIRIPGSLFLKLKNPLWGTRHGSIDPIYKTSPKHKKDCNNLYIGKYIN